METGLDPVNSHWQLQVDGVDKPITAMTWVSGTRFTVDSPGFPAATNAQLTQFSTDPGVKNTNDVLAQPPNNKAVNV